MYKMSTWRSNDETSVKAITKTNVPEGESNSHFFTILSHQTAPKLFILISFSCLQLLPPHFPSTIFCNSSVGTFFYYSGDQMWRWRVHFTCNFFNWQLQLIPFLRMGLTISNPFWFQKALLEIEKEALYDTLQWPLRHPKRPSRSLCFRNTKNNESRWMKSDWQMKLSRQRG
jgi:hypothetical protein